MTKTITALKTQKKNPQRINVYLDGEFAFGLSRIVAAWLQVGQELSDEKIAQLQSEDNFESSYQRVLHYLSIRPRSEKEISKYLIKIGLPPALQEKILERLKSHDWIDDERFAAQWVENRAVFHPVSKRALQFELSLKGIDRETIQKTTSDYDEEESAYQASQKILNRIRELPLTQFKNKIYPYLARRGFSHDVILSTVQRLWTEVQTEKEDLEEIEVPKEWK
ncbi:MAG: regulatory protein RecX [Anaerolineales bacterium]